jgi:hypothetical protein
MGRFIHGRFLEESRWKNTDPAMRDWDHLPPDLKHSNMQQAACIEEIIGRAGFGVRKAKGKIRIRKFSDPKVEIMAEMEHGRWVVERLRSGWKYGSKRDPAKKISPFVRPWSELPEHVKDWDRNAVRNFPQVLAKAGLEIFRKGGT